MDIYYFAFVALYQKRRYHHQESCQRNYFDAVALHDRQYYCRIVELAARERCHIDPEPSGALYHTCIRAVGDHESHFAGSIGRKIEVTYDCFGVRAVA